MPDSRLADLPGVGVPADDDMIYIIDVNAAPPRDRRVDVLSLRKAMLAENASRGMVDRKMLLGISTSSAPIVLDPTIDTNWLGHTRCSLSFLAIFTAVVMSAAGTSQVAGYELKGVVRHQDEEPIATLVATPFRTTYGEDVDWTIEAFIDVADRLAFRFFGTDAKTVNITGYATLVYAQGDS